MDDDKRKEYDETGTKFTIQVTSEKISMKLPFRVPMIISAKCSKKSPRKILMISASNTAKAPWRRKICYSTTISTRET